MNRDEVIVTAEDVAHLARFPGRRPGLVDDRLTEVERWISN